MTENIILIYSKDDIENISPELFNNKQTKFFALNIESHKILSQKNIQHEISDRMITKSERVEIFDYSVRIRDWFKNKNLENKFNFENINVLSILDDNEFQSVIVKILLNLIIIKKIIQNELPKRVFATSYLREFLNCVIQNENNVELDLWENTAKEQAFWDNIVIKQKIGMIPLSIKLSRGRYKKIKKIIENIFCNSFGYWFNFNNRKKESFLFLEFDTNTYSELLLKLADNDVNIICCNIRTPGFRNFSSSRIFKKKNLKILDYENMITQDDLKKIQNNEKGIRNEISNLIHDQNMYKIFKYDSISIWPIIRKRIVNMYEQRLVEYMKMAIIAKKTIEKINLSAIIKLNDIGETEKVFMNYNDKNIPLVLLQHGYTDYNDKSSMFDSTNGYSRIRDKIAVWGETQKRYLIEKRNVLPEKIFVSGSPKHDKFFHREMKVDTKKKTILLAPRAITEMTAEDNIDLHIRYEKLLERILSFTTKNPNIELIVKLHPIQLEHNNELIEYFKKWNPAINVKINSPVIDEIEKSDAIISITSEEWDLSSIVLESQIMNKPILNISPTDKRSEFQCVKENSIISMTDKDDIEEAMQKILFDNETKNKLKDNTKEYLKRYLANPGDASSKFADYLRKSTQSE